MGQTQGDVLVTGATGFVGAELVARLLRARPGSKIFCLMRARDDAELARRRASLLDYTEIGGGDAARIVAVAGDLDADRLGLARADEIAERVGEIFHAAATTRFDLPLEEARRVNVEGTRGVIAFARRAHGAGGLRRLHHVSTAYVAGDPDVPRGAARFRNAYEQSKWEAELELERAGDRLPVSIYRPSIVVGDSRTGRTRHFRVLYEPVKWVYHGRTDVLPCRADVRLDVVPVDFVADAILALAARGDTQGGTFTLAAGEAGSISIRDIIEISVAAANVHHARTGLPPIVPPRVVSPESAEGLDAEARAQLDKLFELAAGAMRMHLPYMLTEQLFEDAATRERLEAMGVRCPPLASYLAEIIGYGLRHDFGRRQPPTEAA